MIWFTADQHFGHKNIIKHCKRPFSNIADMDTELIERWNYCVQPSDRVYHLGDFTLKGHEEAKKYFGQLNGAIYILANYQHHDKYWIDQDEIFSRSGQPVMLLPPIYTLEYEISGEQFPFCIVLSHFPQAVWDRKHYGSIHLHGHCHGNYTGVWKCLDVGVDNHEYYPISLLDVLFEFNESIVWATLLLNV